MIKVVENDEESRIRLKNNTDNYMLISYLDIEKGAIVAFQTAFHSHTHVFRTSPKKRKRSVESMIIDNENNILLC